MVNYLEQLISEWYEYLGYFVHRDLWVGFEPDGSYECELNVVAFNPMKNRLVHIEPSIDLLNWDAREEHFRLKFDAGRKYLPKIFGFVPSTKIDQIALLVYSGEEHPHTVAGGRVLYIHDLLEQIFSRFATFNIASNFLPEQWPLLRTLQISIEYRDTLCGTLLKHQTPAPTFNE